jgi:hypothetical protein
MIAQLVQFALSLICEGLANKEISDMALTPRDLELPSSVAAPLRAS